MQNIWLHCVLNILPWKQLSFAASSSLCFQKICIFTKILMMANVRKGKMRNGDYDNKWWLRRDEDNQFSKVFLPFSEDVFLIFFMWEKAKQMREEMSNEWDSWFASLTKQGKKRNSTLLKGSVVNLFFWEFFSFQSVIFSNEYLTWSKYFHTKMIHTILKWRKEINS